MAKQHKDMAGRPVDPIEKPSEGHAKFNEMLHGRARPKAEGEAAFSGLFAEPKLPGHAERAKRKKLHDEQLRLRREGRL
jgi:hypothetical protein